MSRPSPITPPRVRPPSSPVCPLVNTCSVSQCIKPTGCGTTKPLVTANTRPLPPTPAAASSAARSAELGALRPLLRLAGAASRQTMR